MNGVDSEVSQILVNVAEEAGCDAHGAIMHLIEGDGAYAGSLYYMGSRTAPDGSRPLLPSTPVRFSEVLPVGVLDDVEADEVRVTATGNEGPAIENLCCYAAIMFWCHGDPIEALEGKWFY